MSRYEKPVWKMIYEVLYELPEIFTPVDVIRRVKKRYPEVKENTVRAHVIALTPNHPSSKYHSIRRKFFYYLGNGRYRLLKPGEGVTLSNYQGYPRTEESLPRSEEKALFKSHLSKADKLLDQGFYSEAIGEYGRVLEELFKQLYSEYLPQLSYKDKENAVIYEKKKEKQTYKFTIGEWLGLFQYARLFSFISLDKKGKEKAFIFFTPPIIDIIKTLRNMAIHAGNDQDYINRETALFVKSAILCILHELGIS